MLKETTLPREQAVTAVTKAPKPNNWIGDIGAHVILLVLTAIVLFPILWVISIAIDPRNLQRPTGLIPPGASLAAFQRIFTEPFANGVTFGNALKNSLIVSGGTALVAGILSATAGYAFSRFRFPGRQGGMLSFILIQAMPSVATLPALFVLLGLVGVRRELIGLMIAYGSGALPFLIWNLKGYFDTIPVDLEEAALIDGAGPFQAFIRVVLPLALPVFAVNILFSFIGSWSEYLLAWTLLTDPDRFTLPMVLAGLVGQYATQTPWSSFAALSIIMSLPVMILFFFLQRWIVSGLSAGGVKG